MVTRPNAALTRTILSALAAVAAALIPSLAIASPPEPAAAAANEQQDVVAKPSADKADSDMADKAEKGSKHKKGRHEHAKAAKGTHTAKAAPTAQPKTTAKKATKKVASRTTKKKAGEKKATEKAPIGSAEIPGAERASSRHGRGGAPHAVAVVRAPEMRERVGTARGRDGDQVSTVAPNPACYGVAVAIDRAGEEGEHLPLVDCAGHPIQRTRERLSMLARPWGSVAPAGRANALLDSGLPIRLEAIARAFPGKTLSIVSGYRPQSDGSLHQQARALDIRLVGVTNEELVAFCRTLPDTGCGYYPNSSFVHVDVRAPGSGSAFWIDASGPNEPPRYVTQWPETGQPRVSGAPKTATEPHSDALPSFP